MGYTQYQKRKKFWMILKLIIDIFDILIVIFVNICNIVYYIKYYI